MTSALSDLQALDRDLAALERHLSRNALQRLYPVDGPLSRDAYPKHQEFWRLGRTYHQRALMGGNQAGKTMCGFYEGTLHLTGQYPVNWEGYRFTKPPRTWIASDTAKHVRDRVQHLLIGPKHHEGTGLIPGAALLRWTPGGLPDAIDSFFVQHASGGVTPVTFKSYEQGSEVFESEPVDLLIFDEEPPLSVYIAGLARTAVTEGIILSLFTPTQGLSDTVKLFYPTGDWDAPCPTGMACIRLGWKDAPHMSEASKARLHATIPPFQRLAREDGIPQLGSGAIYPVDESLVLVDAFEIPKFWKRAYGLDVGWRVTAAVFGAENPDSGLRVVYDEYYGANTELDDVLAQSTASVHAREIQKRGAWIPGAIDPASRGRSQTDGRRLLSMYRDLGLDVTEANNAVFAGTSQCYDDMVSGSFKIMRQCGRTIGELRTYQRDLKGEVVKKDDHCMDGMRYYRMTGVDRAIVQPVVSEASPAQFYPHQSGWMR